MRRAVVGSSGSNTSGASSSCPRPAAVNHSKTHHLHQVPSGAEQRGRRTTCTRLSAANSSSSSSDGFARNEAQPRRIDSSPNQPKTLVRVKYQVSSLSSYNTYISSIQTTDHPCPLQLHYRVHSRQILCIGGSHIPLGWSFLSIAKVPMTWNAGDIWTCEVREPDPHPRLSTSPSNASLLSAFFPSRRLN